MIANLAVEAIGTSAVEFVLGLIEQVGRAGAVVLAGVALAAGERYGAVLAAEERIAVTEVVGLAVGAVAMLAGVVELALVDVLTAVVTLETRVALAAVVSEVVNAGAFVARVTLALVDVYFAVLA